MPRSRFSRQEVLATATAGAKARGTNPAVGSTYELLWPYSTAANFVHGSGSIHVASSDANDDGSPVGTGARTAVVTGMVSGVLTTETVTLNGTTPVNLTTAFTRILQIAVATVGSGLVNAGDLYVYTGADTAGVPDVATEVYAKCPAGENTSSAALCQVPTGRRGYILRWWASASGVRDYNGTPDFAWDQGAVQLQLRSRSSDGTIKVLGEAFLSDRAPFAPPPFDLPIVVAAGDDVHVVAKTLGTSATPPVSGGVEVVFGQA